MMKLLFIWLAKGETLYMSFGLWYGMIATAIGIFVFFVYKNRREQLVRTIDDRVKEIWNLYCLQFSLEKSKDACRKVFCDDALLYYFQQLYGYSHYLDGHEENKERIKVIVENRILGGIYNVILAHTIPVGNAFDIPHSYTPVLSKAGYFMSFDVDLNHLLYSKKLLERLTNKRNELRAVELHGKGQFSLYEKLWKECLPDLNKIVDSCKSGLDGYTDCGSIKQLIKQSAENVITILRSNGISLYFKSDGKRVVDEDLFLAMDEGFEQPLVIRDSDGYVYYKGRTLN